MNITTGKICSAQKVVVYGPEGIGKSSFAAQFPDPLFIDTEGSTKELDVKRLDKPSSWAMLLTEVEFVRKNPTVCKSLIIDTIDWAEQLCLADICAVHGKKGIEDFGYGNGYVYEKESFGKLLNSLEEVVNQGVHVVLTAHAQLRKFEQPDEMGAYDRWELKLGKKTASQISPLVKEWADMVLFANYNVFTVKTEDKKIKAQGGKRVMYTTHNPSWDAKNRHSLADELPFEYVQIAGIIERNSADRKTIGTTKPTPIDALTDIAEKAKVADIPVVEVPVPKKAPTLKPLDQRISKPLRDLMVANQVSEGDIQWAVGNRGYFPADMKIWEYPPDFVEQVLVGSWKQVYALILQERPFVED